MLILAMLLAVGLSVEARMFGWGTDWTYSYNDGNCLVTTAVQTNYIFWIAVDSREVEVGRNCTDADHGTPSSPPTNPNSKT